MNSYDDNIDSSEVLSRLPINVIYASYDQLVRIHLCIKSNNRRYYKKLVITRSKTQDQFHFFQLLLTLTWLKNKILCSVH